MDILPYFTNFYVFIFTHKILYPLNSLFPNKTKYKNNE